ncbi:MAG: Fur family transcriptional regulator [Bacteroidota bacterium]
MNGRLPRMQGRLAKERFRITPQRRTVLETLSNGQAKHLTAEQIHRSAQARGLRLSMATVYRALSDLEKLGLVTRLDAGSGPATYELALTHPEPHCHLICLGCGRVFEAQGILPEDFKKVIAQTRNFEVASRSIGIFGYCETCRSKEKVPRRKEV